MANSDLFDPIDDHRSGVVHVSPPYKPTPADHEVLRILDENVEGETIAMSYDRRERELCEHFARLGVAECRALQRRLQTSTPVPSDPIVLAFARLIPERRQRLVAFVADARWREAMRDQEGRGR